jgi:hypothetical protein
MPTFWINLNLFIIPSVLSLAIGEEGILENRLSFEPPRWFLFDWKSEHVLLTGHNLANISTIDSIFNIHYRYSIHDSRLVIMDSHDDHELYKVMCKPNIRCVILKDGIKLFQMNVSHQRADLYEDLNRRRSLDIGYNWTISFLPDRKKRLLFHKGYSTHQPLAEFFPLEILTLNSRDYNYSLNIAQQSLFEPAFLLAMSMIVETL